MTLTWTEQPPNFNRWVSNIVEHGLKDGKGRSIGNYACIHTRDSRAEKVPGQWQYKIVPCELYYYVTTQATRDGKGFGAIVTNGTEAATLDAAKALAAKKIAAAGKRFARAVAKGTGKQFAGKAVAS
jgi:hypothetical protein